MEVKLTVYYGDVKKTFLEFSKKEISVGRALDCDVIVNDPSVSSKHFIIINSKGTISVKDEGSINGTFVNGKQVIGETQIFPGDKITFCGYTIEIDFEGHARSNRDTNQQLGNKTVVLKKDDFLSDFKNKDKQTNKKKIVFLSIALVIILAGIAVLLFVPPPKKQVKHAPIRVDIVDKYFFTLEKRINKATLDKQSVDNAERFFKLGQDQLKMKNLNKEALYNALVYFFKAKSSLEGMGSKPPIWDKIIPAVNSTKRELKMTLKKLFKDAWLLESDGNKQGAKDVYLAIMQTIPDENSRIYINALRRYNLLK